MSMSLKLEDYNVTFSSMEMNASVMKEAGSNEQLDFRLVHKDYKENIIECRAKKINDCFREALTYMNLYEEKSSLTSVLPEFIGVYDSDEENFLDKQAVESLKGQDLEGRNYYLILKNCTKKFEDGKRLDVGAKIQDFKFSTHYMNTASKTEFVSNRFFKKIFFSLSDFPFVYQKCCKSSFKIIYIIKSIWNRICAIINTKSEMKKQFQRLNDENLATAIDRIKKIRSTLEENNFIAFDSSLLFVPTVKKVDGQSLHDVDIHLIDLGDLTHRDDMDEETYKETKREMLEAVEKAMKCAQAIQEKRNAAFSSLHLNPSYTFEALPILHNQKTYHFRDILKKEFKVWRKSESAKLVRFEKYISDKFKENPKFFECCKAHQVRYLSEDERIQTQVQIEDGVLKQIGLDHDGGVRLMPEGEYYFVIKDNALYCHPKGSTGSGVVQHSSFFSGEKVDSAGLLVVDEGGKVKKMINHSGYYLPDADALYTASRFFKERLPSEEFQKITINFVNMKGNLKNLAGWVYKRFKIELFSNKHAINDWIRHYEIGC